MGFIMDGLDAEAYDRTYDDRVLLQRISAYFRPELRRIFIVATMIVVAALVDVGLCAGNPRPCAVGSHPAVQRAGAPSRHAPGNWGRREGINHASTPRPDPMKADFLLLSKSVLSY